MFRLVPTRTWSFSAKLLSSWSVPSMELFFPRCRLCLPLVELYEAPVSRFLQLDKVPLDGSMTLWCISHSSQFYVIIGKLAEDTLCPINQIINEGVGKQGTCPYRSLGYTISHWPPTRLHTTNHHALGLAIKPVFSLSLCLLQPTQLLYKDLMG